MCVCVWCPCPGMLQGVSGLDDNDDDDDDGDGGGDAGEGRSGVVSSQSQSHFYRQLTNLCKTNMEIEISLVSATNIIQRGC